MKATKEQYDNAVFIYENKGASAVFAFAEKIGIDSYSFCRDCEEHTPDVHDDSCLVCGLLKPPARRPKLVLNDDFSVLMAPLESRQEDRFRKFPPFAGGDDWHKVTAMLDLNVWEDGDETKAAIYLVADGKTLTGRDCFIPVEVIDNRTKPEPEPESIDQTIERLLKTIEDVRQTAQRAINAIVDPTHATIIQHALDKTIEKHQQSY